jgi:hypothetical protein
MATIGRYDEVRITSWSENRRHDAADQVIGSPDLKSGDQAEVKKDGIMPPLW